MASLSPALRLGDLPPPHRTFQGHAPHIIEWSMMLRPNDSWSTCRPQGIATLLHYASRRSAGYRDTTERTNKAQFFLWVNGSRSIYHNLADPGKFESERLYSYNRPRGSEGQKILSPTDFVVHSFRPPMEEAMSRLWSQWG